MRLERNHSLFLTSTASRRVASVAVAVLFAGALSGCSQADRYATEERMRKGIVYILPGIEGESANNRQMRDGIIKGGVPYAVKIHPWGFPVPGIGLVVNQTNAAGNRRAGARLAGEIVAYQRAHPGRPVFLAGHSGGGGVSIFTLEALAEHPQAQPVEGAFLVSASISADYDLTTALTMVRRGVVNAYNPEDTALLGVGTAIMGNVDGRRGASAGQAGFTFRDPKLFQRRLTGADVGLRGDPHTVLTNVRVIAERSPRWLKADRWPPPGAE